SLGGKGGAGCGPAPEANDGIDQDSFDRDENEPGDGQDQDGQAADRLSRRGGRIEDRQILGRGRSISQEGEPIHVDDFLVASSSPRRHSPRPTYAPPAAARGGVTPAAGGSPGRSLASVRPFSETAPAAAMRRSETVSLSRLIFTISGRKSNA